MLHCSDDTVDLPRGFVHLTPTLTGQGTLLAERLHAGGRTHAVTIKKTDRHPSLIGRSYTGRAWVTVDPTRPPREKAPTRICPACELEIAELSFNKHYGAKSCSLRAAWLGLRRQGLVQTDVRAARLCEQAGIKVICRRSPSGSFGNAQYWVPLWARSVLNTAAAHKARALIPAFLAAFAQAPSAAKQIVEKVSVRTETRRGYPTTGTSLALLLLLVPLPHGATERGWRKSVYVWPREVLKYNQFGPFDSNEVALLEQTILRVPDVLFLLAGDGTDRRSELTGADCEAALRFLRGGRN